eukprot:m.17398 g.17398  ORF g.17398 m.17398 type:complete len:168 (+) comp3497_c0_seq1:73-576(+)
MDLYQPMGVTDDGGGGVHEGGAGAGASTAPEGGPRQDKDRTIRVTVNGKIRKYVTAAKKILHGDGDCQLRVYGEGRAVTKAISCAEVLKHRIVGLHQNTTIGMTKVTEVWEPKLDVEEDVDRVQVVRRVPTVSIVLSLTPLDHNAPGYQPPLPESEVTVEPTIDDAT